MKTFKYLSSTLYYSTIEFTNLFFRTYQLWWPLYGIVNKYNDLVRSDSKITQQLNHGWITAISYRLTKIKFSFILYCLSVVYYLMMQSVWVIKRASVQVKCHKIEPRPTIYFSLIPFNFYCISSLSYSVSFRSPHYYSFVNILYTFLSDEVF